MSGSGPSPAPISWWINHSTTALDLTQLPQEYLDLVWKEMCQTILTQDLPAGHVTVIALMHDALMLTILGEDHRWDRSSMKNTRYRFTITEFATDSTTPPKTRLCDVVVIPHLVMRSFPFDHECLEILLVHLLFEKDHVDLTTLVKHSFPPATRNRGDGSDDDREDPEDDDEAGGGEGAVSRDDSDDSEPRGGEAADDGEQGPHVPGKGTKGAERSTPTSTRQRLSWPCWSKDAWRTRTSGLRIAKVTAPTKRFAASTPLRVGKWLYGHVLPHQCQ